MTTFRIGTFLRKQRGFLFCIFAIFAFKSAIADWSYIPSSSMNPTIWAGDKVAVNKLAYNLRVPFTQVEIARWAHPSIGDVVTFTSPDNGLTLIKRVVAVGGDTVSMEGNVLFINGIPSDRKLITEDQLIPTEHGQVSQQVWREHLPNADITVSNIPAINIHRDFAPVMVPKGHVMVLGDSRDNSNDSRFIGFIDERLIAGKAFRVVLSTDTKFPFFPRGDRWFLPLKL